MEYQHLSVNVRKTTGKNNARALRRQGKFPAILYGPDTQPLMLSLPIHDFDLILQKSSGGQVIFKLAIEGEETNERMAILKDLQTPPTDRTPLHADFYEISMDRKINVMVPVVTTGKCKGVELGGMLQIVRRELEVLCLPSDIPESIEIDITDLDVGDSVHKEEVPLVGEIEIPDEANYTILTVLAPTMEEEEEEIEEEGEELEEGEEGEEVTEEKTAEES